MVETDYHVHTSRCGHAGGAMRDYVLAAIEKGLSGIAFTDHLPAYFLPGEDPAPTIAMTRAELPGYVEEVVALREEFSSQIEVLLGIEADFAEGHEGELAQLLAPWPWDVVLGSVHWVAGGWIDAPGSAARHGTEGSARLWDEYYRLLALAALSGLFDVLTHFDLPKKYGNRCPDESLASEEAAVAATKRAGVAIEVSSSGLRKPIAETYPAPGLLARLVSASVPCVFSSDAHAPAEVGWGREKVIAAARAAGAKTQAVIRAGRVSLVPL